MGRNRAVRAATAANACHFFLEQVVLRHGAPARLLTDKGSHFCNKMLEQLTKLVGTEHVTTSGYHPQCNGLTERMNLTLAQATKVYVSADHKDWDELVPYITFCINTSKQETTRFTPFELLYGRPAVFPQDYAVGFNGFANVDEHTEWVNRLHSWLQEAREIAKARVNSTYLKVANRHNEKHADVRYKVRDLVWLWVPPGQRRLGRKTNGMGLTTKFLYSWRGLG